MDKFKDEKDESFLGGDAVISDGFDELIVQGKTFIDLFLWHASRSPEKCALVFEGNQWSYRDLLRESSRWQQQLHENGISHGNRVLVGLSRGPELVALLLGIMRAGACYVPIDPSFPRKRIELIAENSGATAAVLDDEINDLHLENEIQRLSSAEQPGNSEESTLKAVTNESAPEHTAYLIYTSGSTGIPKGVPISHAALLNFLLAMRERPGIDASDRMLALTTVSFDISVLELFLPLIAGASVHLVSRDTAVDPRALAESIQVGKPTVLQATPATWRMLLESGWKPDQSQKVLCGGEALSIEVARELLAARELWNMYGPTEATVWSSCHRVGAADIARGRIPIGDPLPNVEYRVTPSENGEQTDTSEGELLIAGVCLTHGYFRRPDLNEERFIITQDDQGTERRFYRTGDLVVKDSSEIFYLGRLDNQIKIRGYRVELGEIEEHLLEVDSDISQAVVIKHSDNTSDGVLVAFVRGWSDIDFGAVEDALRQRLPSYMVPGVWRQIQEFPLTPNLKIDRNTLSKWVTDRPQGNKESGEAVSADLSEASSQVKGLAALWKQVLGVSPSSSNDSFFALGGHSLLAARLSLLIEEQFNKRVPVDDLLEHPVLDQQMERIQACPLTPSVRQGEVANEETAHTQSLAIPRSKTQERMQITADLLNQPEIFNESEAYWLLGNVDKGALKEAAGQLLKQHDAFAIRHRADGKGWLIVEPTLEWQEMRCGPELDDPEWLKAELQKEAKRPFDLTKGPLIRFKYYQAHNKSLLQISAHHQIVDGLSQTLMWQSIQSYYRMIREGRSISPGEGAAFTQYLNQVDKKASPEDQEYWRRIFRSRPPVLNIVTDRPRQPSLDLHSRQASINVPREQWDQTTQLARRLNTTPFAIILSVYGLLLSSYTEQDEFVIGTPVSQRPSEWEKTLGLFINTLPLRLELGGKSQLEDIVKHVHGRLLGAMRHQALSFDRIVEIASPSRDPSRTPLYQTLFTFNDFRDRPSELEKHVEMQAQPVDTGFSHAELVMFADCYQNGVQLRMQASRQLFDKTTVKAMLAHFQKLWVGLLEGTSGSPWDISLITSTDSAKLDSWNDTSSAYPRDASVYSCFHSQLAGYGDNIAIEQGKQRITYNELDKASKRVAAALLAAGVGKGTRVATLVDKSWQAIAAILGILRLGGVYVPLDRAYPVQRMQLLLAESHTHYVIGQYAADQSRISGDVQWIDLGDALKTSDNSAPETASTASDPAYIMFTSGSTGVPKGVEVVNRNIVRLVKETNYLKFDETIRFLMNAPISFDASTLEIWGPLLNGGTLVIPERETLNAKALSDLLLSGSVNAAWLTAALFHQMAEHHADAFRKLDYLLSGGDVLSARWVRATLENNPGLTLINGYGPTENTTFTCCYPMSDAAAVPDRVPIGYPIANTRVYIVDDNGRQCPPGVPGELFAAGDGVTNGYINAPQRNREVFVPGKGLISGEEKLYRTGDRARWRHDGVLEFLGRKDHQVKIRGYRVEPGEVSAALESFDEVNQAVTTVQKGKDDECHLIAYVVLEPSLAEWTQANTLKKWLEERLPRFMLPSDIVILQEMPVDPNGKIDRKALPVSDLLTLKQSKGAPPATEREAKLLSIWQEILGSSEISVTDDFFEWGGSSLTAVELFGRIESEFGCDLPLSVLLKHGTVRELSELIGARDGNAAADTVANQSHWNNLVVLDAKGHSRPVVCIHAVGGNVLGYRELLDLENLNRPVLGFQSSGLNGVDIPPDSIHRMAANYVEELMRSGYQGPFTLVGGSMGGTIALEMALLLEKHGQEVDWVVLLDTIGPAGRKPEIENIDESLLARFRHSLRSRTRSYLKKLQIQYYRQKGLPLPVSLRPFFIKEQNTEALYRHSEKPYSGNVLLMRAPIREQGIYADPYLGWQGILRGKLVIEHINALHESFLESPETKERLNQFFNEKNADKNDV
ncbi:amino acid adenylation domain-containing protein [Marinobacteraceae bacterium S3BR75-40.1]